MACGRMCPGIRLANFAVTFFCLLRDLAFIILSFVFFYALVFLDDDRLDDDRI